ncbi:putative ISxac2 transposase [endosymbiont of Tevnia jerichonana (vent Tica)]|uniref:Putative ISxac2 transposase n=1 Tax=endosymbiont of Tevnia jerichonana (vent Tica) TaxID=1049564 RepID=G2FGG5_9GAMM|nr:putative ISxac2 transposase [endosymbiont of Tevnia jerichonana (vent Tica)]
MMTSTGKDWALRWISHCQARARDPSLGAHHRVAWPQPAAIRPEYISGTLQAWTEKRGICLDYIQPANPQQNGYIGPYNRTVRYDWLKTRILRPAGYGPTIISGRIWP